MKKLMMVAAVAAIATGAIAADNPQLWNVKINLKAFNYNWLKCTDAGSSGCVTCDVNEWNETGAWYAENETRKIEAILVNCDPCALTFADEQNATNLAFFAWDATHQVALTQKATEGKSARWAMANGNCLTNYNGVFQTFLYGKKINKAGVTLHFEAKPYTYGIAEYQLTAVGFGTWDLKNDRLSSASGNVLGTAPVSDKGKAGYEYAPYGYAHIYQPTVVCDAVAYCSEGDNSSRAYNLPTYGTFTIKYNASKAKNYVKALPARMVY